jgi:hypothetical protein
MPRASSPIRALGIFLKVAGILAVAVGPGQGVAFAASAPAASGTRSGVAATSSPAGERSSPTRPTPSPPEDRGADPPLAPISPEAATARPLDDPGRAGQDQPSLVAPPNNVSPVSTTAGMGGRTISADDPEARRARAELEGTALSSDKAVLADVPARLPPLQRGAWWSMFGAFALASTGGVFAGLAEVQEDKAERLAITLDSSTGMQLPCADIQGEYADILRVGRRDAGVARGFLAASTGFLVAGVALFIVHAVRVRKADRARRARDARVGVARGGLEVRF